MKYTPVTHLYKAIYSGYNSIYKWIRGPPCIKRIVFFFGGGETTPCFWGSLCGMKSVDTFKNPRNPKHLGEEVIIWTPNTEAQEIFGRLNPQPPHQYVTHTWWVDDRWWPGGLNSVLLRDLCGCDVFLINVKGLGHQKTRSDLHSLELTASSPLKIGLLPPKAKDGLPISHFQVLG